MPALHNSRVMTEPLYQWIPERGPSLAAIERMRAHFSKPEEPMGEAWFNTNARRIFTELNDEESFKKIKPSDLSIEPLFEISSGISCFGHREEWDAWFKYLLPSLISRSREHIFFSGWLLQPVVTDFMAVYWTGIPEEYPGFRQDVLDSLSQCLMGDWPEDEPENVSWNWAEPEKNISAMMFFCLKYLNREETVTWVRSIFEIEDIYWRAALAVWLSAAWDILNEPLILPSMIEKAKPELEWENFHTLGSQYGSADARHPPHNDYNDNKDFIPGENPKLFVEQARKYLTSEKLIQWACDFSTNKLIEEATWGITEKLLEKIAA